VVSGINHETEVDWTPPLNNPRNIRQYKITYRVSSQQVTKILQCYLGISLNSYDQVFLPSG
jgi:hypothetical protein